MEWFSSTNHYRILNQLRTEISSYPIKRKSDNQKKNYSETNSSKVSHHTDSLSGHSKISFQNDINDLNRNNFTEINTLNFSNTDTEIFNNTNKIKNYRNNDNKKDKTISSNIYLNDTKELVSNESDLSVDNNRENQTQQFFSKNEENNSINNDQPKELPITFKDRLSQIDMR